MSYSRSHRTSVSSVGETILLIHQAAIMITQKGYWGCLSSFRPGSRIAELRDCQHGRPVVTEASIAHNRQESDQVELVSLPSIYCPFSCASFVARANCRA